MKPLKVVLIESEQQLIDKLIEYYSHVFEKAGYVAEYFGATSETSARKLIDQEWPHVIVCDMTFGHQSDGLIILRNLINDYPDLFYILASRAEYSIRDVTSKRAFFDLFFDKGEILAEDKDYILTLASQFRKSFRFNTVLKLDPTYSAYKSDFSAKELREFSSLVSQITFTGHDSDLQLTPDTVKISRLSGGLSGSKVYKFTSFNSNNNIESIPAVLKISAREYAQAEINNYNKFVKWGVPYIWRVDILGTGLTKKYGAVSYSFIQGGVGDKIKSLTDLLETGNYKSSSEIIGKVFSPEMRRWYGDELIEEHQNINHRYSERYFRGQESKRTSANKFKEICAKLFGVAIDGTTITVQDNILGEPISKLFGTPNGKFRTCICHGDLNSNNVITSSDNNIIFIDFQETGRGHVFEDFVTMESSVRLSFKSPMDINWNDYLICEKNICNHNFKQEHSAAHLLMAEIRDLAFANFPNESKRNYYYAVAAFNFRLLRASLNEIQYNKCAIAVIAALSKL